MLLHRALVIFLAVQYSILLNSHNFFIYFPIYGQLVPFLSITSLSQNFFHVSLWTCQFLQGVTRQPSPISSSYTLKVVAKWFSKVVIWIYNSTHNVFKVLLLHIFTNAYQISKPFPNLMNVKWDFTLIHIFLITTEAEHFPYLLVISSSLSYLLLAFAGCSY